MTNTTDQSSSESVLEVSEAKPGARSSRRRPTAETTKTKEVKMSSEGLEVSEALAASEELEAPENIDDLALEASLCQQALQLEHAINLSGIVHTWSEILHQLWKIAKQRGEGTGWINRHPINVLIANRAMQLACDQYMNQDRYAMAYREVRSIIGRHLPHHYHTNG
jgi:hypothetical protein